MRQGKISCFAERGANLAEDGFGFEKPALGPETSLKIPTRQS